MVIINKELKLIGEKLLRIEEELVKINTREDAKLTPSP